MMRHGKSGKSIISKLNTFFKSLYFHLYRGMPKSSQFLINSRYSDCQECESFYDNQCLECGCRITKKKEFLNKLAWKDQECPLDRWNIK